MLRLQCLLSRGLVQRHLTSHQARRPFSIGRHLRFPRRVDAASTPALSAVENGPSFASKVGKPSIQNQVLFFVLGSSAAFLYAAFNTNLETNLLVKKIKEQSSLFTLSGISNRDLVKVQQMELVKELRMGYAELNRKAATLPPIIRQTVMLEDMPAQFWGVAHVEDETIGYDTQLYAQPAVRFELHAVNECVQSFMHLAFNCLALEGFGAAASTYLNKSISQEAPDKLESTSNYHFMAFYLSAGLFASLVSHVVSVKLKYPRIIAQLSSPSNTTKVTDTWASAVAASAANTPRSLFSTKVPSATAAAAVSASERIVPSLGASGAIYACVTMTALAFPQAQISLIIPPWYPIDIQTGVAGLVALDIIGIARGWRMFDHWAHLGGAAFGAAYYAYGPKLWVNLRSETKA
uniref:Peptidase S54 rhomboid domain-containing protein n=1 Tax=Moniliophthora roreri TaxID=221103 RepID=A0A0W0EYY9_MONRR